MQAVPFGPNYTNFLLFFGIFESSRTNYSKVINNG